MVAKIRKQFTSAVEWLREAGRLAKLDGTVDVSSVQVELIDTIRQVKAVVVTHFYLLPHAWPLKRDYFAAAR